MQIILPQLLYCAFMCSEWVENTGIDFSFGTGSFEIFFWCEFVISNQSVTSLFRYTNKPSEPQHSSLSGVCNQQKEFETDSEKNFSNILTACNSYTPAATLSTQRSVNSLATGHSKQSELAVSYPQQRPCPVPVSVKGMNLNNISTSYGSVPHVFCVKSGLITNVKSKFSQSARTHISNESNA